MVQLIFDDTESSISYSKNWRAQQSQESTFNNTVHCTTAASTTATFDFHGTFVALYGTIKANPANSTSTYQVDGSPEETFTVAGAGQDAHQQVFFQSKVLSDAEHTLTMTSDIDGVPLCLDFIMVTPSATGLVSQIDDRDRRIQYSSGWAAINPGASQFRDTTQVSNVNGATAQLTFFGTSVTVYGTIIPNLPGFVPPAEFSVDDSEVVNTTAPMAPDVGSGVKLYQVPLYQSPLLDSGPHLLNIKVTASGAHVWLDFLMLNLLQPSNYTTATPSTRDSTPLIIGGGVGGVALLGVVLSLVVLFKMKRRKRLQDPEMVVSPFTLKVEQTSLDHTSGPSKLPHISGLAPSRDKAGLLAPPVVPSSSSALRHLTTSTRLSVVPSGSVGIDRLVGDEPPPYILMAADSRVTDSFHRG